MLQKMLTAAVALGATIIVGCEGETDYTGSNVMDAMDAIEAVDECDVYLRNVDGEKGWAYVVNDLDEDERIADAGGWVDRWLDTNA